MLKLLIFKGKYLELKALEIFWNSFKVIYKNVRIKRLNFQEFGLKLLSLFE